MRTTTARGGIVVAENLREQRQHEDRTELKLEILTHYSPKGLLKCSWEGCKVDDLDMLSLDHVNDDGAKHILPGHKDRLGGTNLYRWTKKNGFPEGFQTLCANHQIKKQILKNRKNLGL